MYSEMCLCITNEDFFSSFCLHLSYWRAVVRKQADLRDQYILGSSSNETRSLLLMTDILTVRGLGLGSDTSAQRHAGPRGIPDLVTVSALQKHY